MTRKYETSHPWLNFNVDLNELKYTDWINLGKAASKIEHIANSILKPGIAKEFNTLYLAKGVNATTQIEGNTLSEEEVRRVIEGNYTAPPSRKYLEQEVQNVLNVCKEITARLVKGEDIHITPQLINSMNKAVLADLEHESHVQPGVYRSVSVHAGGYVGAPVEDIDHLMEKLCSLINEFPMPEGLEKENALLKAMVAHLYMAWIHPYGDGNGRTARLLEFLILIESGYPQPTAHLLSNHYNLTRTEYYRRLDSSKKPNGGVAGFFAYGLQGFLDGIQEQIDIIHGDHFIVAWTNFIYESFAHKKGAAQRRRRNLALNLKVDFMKVSEIPDLSPDLAREYATKTKKAISGDLNALEDMGLIERRHGLVRARREIMLAFLPWSR